MITCRRNIEKRNHSKIPLIDRYKYDNLEPLMWDVCRIIDFLTNQRLYILIFQSACSETLSYLNGKLCNQKLTNFVISKRFVFEKETIKSAFNILINTKKKSRMLLPCAVVEDTCDIEKDERRYSSSFVHLRRMLNEISQRRKCSRDSIDSVKSTSSGTKSNRITFGCDVSEGSDSYSDNRSTSDSVCSASSLYRKEKGSLKRRFKRMISQSLRRSQSAGCANDVPAHASFLRESYMDRRHNTVSVYIFWLF